jgi:hypothetical protein
MFLDPSSYPVVTRTFVTEKESNIRSGIIFMGHPYMYVSLQPAAVVVVVGIVVVVVVVGIVVVVVGIGVVVGVVVVDISVVAVVVVVVVEVRHVTSPVVHARHP